MTIARFSRRLLHHLREGLPRDVAPTAQGRDDGANHPTAVCACLALAAPAAANSAAASATASLLLLLLLYPHELISPILENAFCHLLAFRAQSFFGVHDIARLLVQSSMWVLLTEKRRDQLYLTHMDPPAVLDDMYFLPNKHLAFAMAGLCHRYRPAIRGRAHSRLSLQSVFAPITVLQRFTETTPATTSRFSEGWFDGVVGPISNIAMRGYFC